MDVVLQLVVFLVGRIAIFGQFHQQFRRALAMLRSGASVLVYQCSLDQLAQIGFTVHQLLQQGHEGFQYRQRGTAQRGVPGFALDKYLHLVGVLRKVPAEPFHDVAGYGQLAEVGHSGAQFIKCIRTVIFSGLYKLP